MDAPVSKAAEARIEFYRNKGKIHARGVKGRFNTLRWAMVWITQIIFYGACWLQWPGGDGTLRQAILMDIPHERLNLFGLVLWPQDALLLAIMLILAATALFLVTALSGRLFCGFACPQTVYTMIFTKVEALVEGDHLARMRLDQAPLSARKLGIKSVKHGLWLAIAAWTGITFVGYFTPIRELLAALPGWNLGPWEGFWVGFYALFTYLQAGFAREMVCQHMCPYSRFQGVMFDKDTRTVSYDTARGEPRGRGKKAADKGDCVDCGICVQVCPTGIDIRDGLQYQCINCGLCVDACDEVMTRIARPVGLIRYASSHELAHAAPARGRPRLAVYGGLLAVFVGLGAWSVAARPSLRVDVLRDRGVLAREVGEGRVENIYTLKLMNLREAPRDFKVAVSGLPGLRVDGRRQFAVGPGEVREVQLTLSAPQAEDARSGARAIAFQIQAVGEPASAIEEKSTFVPMP